MNNIAYIYGAVRAHFGLARAMVIVCQVLPPIVSAVAVTIDHEDIHCICGKYPATQWRAG